MVWFGESLNGALLDQAVEAALSSDIMLVIGTSAVVQPAASLALYAKENRAVLIEINTEATQMTPLVDLSILGPSGQILPRIIDRISKPAEEQCP